ncbi:MAG: hypothetical protein AAB451_01800 [Patescibacteria group bacterium]
MGELKEDGEDCFKQKLIGNEPAEALAKKCGEIDFLMGRLKSALERKITKEDVLSPYDRWLGREMADKTEENRKFDEELKKIIEGAKWDKGAKGNEK